MNKQELKAKLTKLIDKKGNYDAYSLDSKKRIHAVGIFEGLTKVLKLIDRLDEPKLPVIPQFVADYFEGTKFAGQNFYDAYNKALNHKDVDSEELDKWFNSEGNYETFARAWLDGYTIEPIKTRQVLVKFFDNEEYRTELTEESARQLIEFLEANKK